MAAGTPRCTRQEVDFQITPLLIIRCPIVVPHRPIKYIMEQVGDRDLIFDLILERNYSQTIQITTTPDQVDMSEATGATVHHRSVPQARTISTCPEETCIDLRTDPRSILMARGIIPRGRVSAACPVLVWPHAGFGFCLRWLQSHDESSAWLWSNNANWFWKLQTREGDGSEMGDQVV